MPKMKSNSGAKKRFKVTGSGKIKRKKAFKRHILTKKSSKTKRKLTGTTIVTDADAPKVKELIPYKF
ncbi:MAG: 50S ribosomal protein L35 [Balneola sp.]